MIESNLKELQRTLCGDPAPIRGQAPLPDRREKFKKLTHFNFSSTWFSFDVPREDINE